MHLIYLTLLVLQSRLRDKLLETSVGRPQKRVCSPKRVSGINHHLLLYANWIFSIGSTRASTVHSLPHRCSCTQNVFGPPFLNRSPVFGEKQSNY